MLVAREHAVSNAMVFHKLLPAELKAALLLEAAFEHIDNAGRFKAHCYIHNVGLMVIRAEVRLISALEAFRLFLQRLAQSLPIEGS